MKCLIVDDEPLAVMRLQRMLESMAQLDIMTTNNGKNAVKLVAEKHPHVIFLDIEMPVMGGIEAAQIIKKISPESHIVFCTAYDNFAIKAFDLSASDYLLKPVNPKRLAQALEKVLIDKDNLSITYKIGNNLRSIDVDDIYCFTSEEKATFMLCSLGHILIDETLITLEAQFPHQFLRINRNALINKDELCGIHREKNKAYAQLRNTEFQPEISRRNITRIKQQLK